MRKRPTILSLHTNTRTLTDVLRILRLRF